MTIYFSKSHSIFFKIPEDDNEMLKLTILARLTVKKHKLLLSILTWLRAVYKMLILVENVKVCQVIHCTLLHRFTAWC